MKDNASQQVIVRDLRIGDTYTSAHQNTAEGRISYTGRYYPVTEVPIRTPHSSVVPTDWEIGPCRHVT